VRQEQHAEGGLEEAPLLPAATLHRDVEGVVEAVGQLGVQESIIWRALPTIWPR